MNGIIHTNKKSIKLNNNITRIHTYIYLKKEINYIIS